MNPLTVAQMIREKLDELGADGLMNPISGRVTTIKDIKDFCVGLAVDLVPAFRHADGTYHAFPEICAPCIGSKNEPSQEDCYSNGPCATAKGWLSHKEGDR